MEKRKPVSSTRRLIAGFCALILIFLFFGLFTLYNIHSAAGLTRTIYDHPLAVSNAALQASVSIAKMHGSMQDVVLSDSAIQIQQSIESVNQEEKRVYGYLDRVRDRILGDEGQALEREARTLLDDWGAIRKKVIGLVLDNQREKAVGITVGKDADHVARIEEKMLGLTQYARKKASDFLQQAESLHIRLRTASVIFLLLGIFTSFLVAMLTIRRTALAEKGIEESQERYRSLVESQTDLVCRFTPDGRFVFINDVYCQFFNKSKADLIGSVWQPLPVDDDATVIEQKLSALSPANPIVSIENRVYSGKGDIHWMQFINRGFFDRDGQLLEIQSVGRDITDRKQAEVSLQQREEQYRTIFENAVEGIFQSTPQGRFTSVNPAFARMLGYDTPEELVENISDIAKQYYFNAEDRQRYQRIIQENGIVENYEFRARRKDGSTTWVSNSTQAYFDETGNVIRYEGFVTDINARKQAEREKEKLQLQLLQAQKLESIGNLAGGIAHDFNNILSAILGYTELALDDVEKGSLIENNLNEVFTAGRRARDLVQQILAFARQADAELKPLQVSKIAKEALKLIRSTIPTTIEIRQNIDCDALIMGDPTQINQIFMNLCTNAAFAMEQAGGILAVDLSDVELDNKAPLVQSGLSPGNYLLTTIADTGTGIARDILDSIFEPYFTTKGVGEGTGLGLAVVHGIVEGYGGKITVTSDLGQGTVFSVYLPITRTHDDYRPFEEAILPTGNERILLVDDESSIAKVGSQILERLGYRVAARTSSVEALELFRAKPDDFDLVVTDMTMPNMTGDQLATELIKIRPDVLVILCTGYSNKISDQSAQAMGIKALIYKPIVKADLAKTMRKVLDEART